MTSVLKVFKINLLALLAFPFLLVSIVAKLILKALEKTLVFISVGITLFVLYLLSLIFKNPSSILNGIALIIVVIILGGIITIIMIWVFSMIASIATSLFTMLRTIIYGILGFIFEMGHESYSKFYDICKSDYEDLLSQSSSKSLTFGCVFWHLLKGFNFVITKLFSFALPLSLLVSIGITGYSIYFVHSTIMKTFGIGIFRYLKLFPTAETVFAVLYFVVALFAAVTVLLSLGEEWSEWGKLLDLSTGDYKAYTEMQLMDVQEGWSNNSFEDGKNTERCQQYMNTLNELVNEYEALQQQVDIAMRMKQNSALAYKFSEYATLLNEILKQTSNFKTNISSKVFETQFIPQIEQVNKLSKEIMKDLMRIFNKDGFATSKSNTIDFFEGCNSEEDFKKRYKALSKVYHPDAGGHEETFKTLSNQYEEKIKDIQL